MARPKLNKIVISRSIGIAILISYGLFMAMVGWQLYKYTNSYLGYTSGVEFYELTMDFMIDFFDDFNTPQLKLALIGALSSIVLAWIKMFRTRKR